MTWVAILAAILVLSVALLFLGAVRLGAAADRDEFNSEREGWR